MNGIELIAEERKRQVEVEFWSAEHDDEHGDSQMADAAMCYIARAINNVSEFTHPLTQPHAWPWDAEWWKPSDNPVRNLVKAEALIAAEIDRLQRKQDKESARNG